MARKAPHHLSAGQKRAAAIATVVSMSPKIITFDEPDGPTTKVLYNAELMAAHGLETP